MEYVAKQIFDCFPVAENVIAKDQSCDRNAASHWHPMEKTITSE